MTPVICLMGPTAAGKTPLAVELVQRFPFEIISVDSAMIYRGMDIGTAKPTADILRIAPHHLINILDPLEIYSVGQFYTDVMREIKQTIALGKIPLLVGGTMLYFRVLQQGLAQLPTANQALRSALLLRAEAEGWDGLHAYLRQIDPEAAARIHPSDKQRIQRALEVYELTGKPMTAWQKETHPMADYPIHCIAITQERSVLHTRIAERFRCMLSLGLVDEVEQLYLRGDLSAGLPSMRSVGYRQVWSYLAGECSNEEMCEHAITATRQLAKRQLTWLRSWPEITWFSGEVALKADVVEFIKSQLGP
ncbi:MAG: tRNA (adenosine(37)-N6)-dimethylallyltransferase MiaA [Gammaproteobacteria bacterium RIFCSPHIGHO2_12_FULL_37_14]|nr:MAG: tRNA (adenosine(37)-N6)-dimethylallyltransferase MiaA [Gammaproteobacteria bacterium RIFCSPHIGHO2_12_FULL_37_14]